MRIGLIMRIGSSKWYVPPYREAAVRDADVQAVSATRCGDPALELRLQQLHDAVLLGGEDISTELGVPSDGALPPADLRLHEACLLLAEIAPAETFLIPIGQGTVAMRALLAERPTADLVEHLAQLARALQRPPEPTEDFIRMFDEAFPDESDAED